MMLKWELQILLPGVVCYQLYGEDAEWRRMLPYRIDMLIPERYDEERWALYRLGEGQAPGVLVDVFFEREDAKAEAERLVKESLI